jgi:hypothetical protein
MAVTSGRRLQERLGKLVAVFYCKCKSRRRVWAEFWWKPDDDKHEWVFFDDDDRSGTHGQSVTHCSGCGERLHRGRLTAA